MKTPASYFGHYSFSSDNRKKLVFNTSVSTSVGFEKCLKEFDLSGGVSFKPTNWSID
jgi:hypothetical protein